MEQESISDRLEKIKANRERPLEDRVGTRWDNIKRKLIKWTGIGALLITPIAGYFVLDYSTKRNDYPIRNTLVNTRYKVDVAGNKEKRAAEKSDRETVIKYHEGGSIESKLGIQVAETKRDIRGNIENYSMYNEENARVIRSALKNERFQAGWRLGGATTYKEQFSDIAENAVPLKPNMSRKYMLYKVDPERGFKQNDIDVVEFPIERGLSENEPGIIEERKDENGNTVKDVRVMVNRLVESRNLLGFLYGSHYRSGTLLQDFLNTPQNKKLAQEFLAKTQVLDNEESTGTLKREELVNRLLDIEQEMDRETIYSSSEDGFFKILPQGSTIYLGEDPSFLKRAKHYWLGPTRNESNRLRVDNSWDFFPFGLTPGNYPLLDSIPFGSGRDRSYPFDKYNNGGYTLRDKFGDIAKIEFKDFWFNYGQDVVYNYYFDLNGDGVLDKEKELIGKVLCTPTHDEKAEIERLAAGIIPKNDLTFTTLFSFMAPDKDMKKGWDYFKLCAYTESIMADAVRRGYGQHSLLGIINDQRSDEMLRREPNIENISRALTTESILVAKHDIIRVLNAAKRPYSEEYATKWGIHDEFKGEYSSSPQLKEKTELGALPWLLIYAGIGYGTYRGIKSYRRSRRNRKNEKPISDRLLEIKEEN